MARGVLAAVPVAAPGGRRCRPVGAQGVAGGVQGPRRQGPPPAPTLGRRDAPSSSRRAARRLRHLARVLLRARATLRHHAGSLAVQSLQAAATRGRKTQGREGSMSALQLMGDTSVNPRTVTLTRVLASSTPDGDTRLAAIRLNTQALFRVAALAARSGYRVQDVRLDDLTLHDDPELQNVKLRVVELLRKGDSEGALYLLRNAGDLIASGLTLIDEGEYASLFVNRSGLIETTPNKLDVVLQRLRKVLTPHSEIFAR